MSYIYIYARLFELGSYIYSLLYIPCEALKQGFYSDSCVYGLSWPYPVDIELFALKAGHDLEQAQNYIPAVRVGCVLLKN